jgi:hypothetical protein
VGLDLISNEQETRTIETTVNGGTSEKESLGNR